MPKIRESELHHLEGKALQMHSSCVKKAPAARQKEAIDFDVLYDLKKLSDKADQLGEKRIQDDSGLAVYFEAIKKTMEKIRDSNIEDLKNIEYPPSIKTFIHVPVKEEILSLTTAATQVMSGSKKTKQVNNTLSTSKMVTPISILVKSEKLATSDSQMVTPATSIRKKANPFVLMHQLSKQEINVYTDGNDLQNKSKPLLATPVLNRTFQMMNTTMVLDSGSAANNDQTPSGTGPYNDRSKSKKTKENECPNSHGMLTRSGSKRKSSDSKNKSSKKQKIDSNNISSATLNKTAKSRRPLRDLKTSALAAENKNKLSAVIKAPRLQKPSLISKEQQALEELKKRDKKREENLLKIQEEKKKKAEQDKKTREEKRTKTQQKRLQLEKEKEEKLQVEAKKSQVRVNKENPKKTTRAKELVEQHIKESKSSIITSTTQSTNNSDILKTPVNKKSEETQGCSEYDLTPVPDSSTYNFSDEEEEDKKVKRFIPEWAHGVQLKGALIQQFYNPVDTDALFGSVIDPPDLVEIFKMNKKRYFKRTSSAIWSSPPIKFL